MLQVVSACYKVLHRVNEKVFHGVSRCDTVTGCYTLLHGVTKCYEVLHVSTECFRMLQGGTK